MSAIVCEHVYVSTRQQICPSCNKWTFDIDWKEQNKLNAEWKIANPNAKSDGWWSI